MHHSLGLVVGPFSSWAASVFSDFFLGGVIGSVAALVCVGVDATVVGARAGIGIGIGIGGRG